MFGFTLTQVTQGLTIFSRTPLQGPGGIALNPYNNDLLVVDSYDNNPLELNTTSGSLVGQRLLDNVPVDSRTGFGSALSGVAASKDAMGKLAVYFTDKNTNTVNVLSGVW